MSNAKIKQRARENAHVLLGVLLEVDGFFQDPSAKKEDFLEGTGDIVFTLIQFLYSGIKDDKVQSIIDWHTDPDDINPIEGMC